MPTRSRKRGVFYKLLAELGMQTTAVLVVVAGSMSDELTSAARRLGLAEQETLIARDVRDAALGERDDALNVAKSKDEQAAAAGSRAAAAARRATAAVAAAGTLEGNLRDANGRVRVLEREVGGLERHVAGLEGQLGSLRPGSAADVVILVDATASTRPYHLEAKAAVVSLAAWSSRLSVELRVAVCGVRDGVVARHPLGVVRPAGEDSSLPQLTAFLDGLEPTVSPVNHGPAFREAFELLGDADAAGNRRQLVLLISDQGQCETDQRPGLSPAERADARRIAAEVAAWAAPARRTVGVVYAGPEPAGGETHRWFRSLASSPDDFSASAAGLFRIMFHALESEPTDA